jgi:hypothetical protein
MTMTGNSHPKAFGKFVRPQGELKKDHSLQVFDLNGNDVTHEKAIVACTHIVRAAWFPVALRMEVFIQGLILPTMYNETYNKDDKKGSPCFGFEGQGWHPQGFEGGIIVQRLTDPVDRWIVDDLKTMVEAGYKMVRVEEDGRPVYSKPGDPQAAFEMPEGWTVTSMEGPITADGPGYYLVYTDSKKGDFYLWLPELTQSDAVQRL